MIDSRSILYVLGILVGGLGLAQMPSVAVDLWQGHEDWKVFVTSATFSFFVGAALALSCRSGQRRDLGLHEAFLLTTLAWVVMPLFSSIPFMLSDADMGFTDAYFEAMSGLTTTGSTVMTGLDFAPPGILLWRAILQWLGGIGIIVMAIGVLPMLRVGGMQLFRMESSERSDKALPRATQIAGVIAVIYLLLSALCALAYWLAGMGKFDAVAHAMTTIATGGFSTSDGSIGHFDNMAVDYIASLFMVLGSLPFLLYFQAVRGRSMELWRDTQVRWFLTIVLSVITALTVWRVASHDVGLGEALRYTSFNAISIITGTGYSSTDYGAWGGFAVALFFFAMLIGGCAGSTSCGIKVFRFQVLFAAARAQFGRLLQPHGIFVPTFNHRPISESAMDSVMSFFFLFALCFGVLALFLALLGLDPMTALSGAGTAIANVGPGLGDIIGPAGTFQPLPEAAKWALSLGMLLGRLELFTVLVLFTPTFWRN